MNLQTFLLLTIAFGLPTAFVVGNLLMARRDTKGLKEALRQVGFRD